MHLASRDIPHCVSEYIPYLKSNRAKKYIQNSNWPDNAIKLRPSLIVKSLLLCMFRADNNSHCLEKQLP